MNEKGVETMALTVMTQEWTGYINSITVYLIRQREKDEEKVRNLAQTPMRLYNSWAQECGVAVDNTELAVWLTNYMSRMVKMPLNRLKLGAQIDKLDY